MIRNKESKKTEYSWYINLSQPLNVNYRNLWKSSNNISGKENANKKEYIYSTKTYKK